MSVTSSVDSALHGSVTRDTEKPGSYFLTPLFRRGLFPQPPKTKLRWPLLISGEERKIPTEMQLILDLPCFCPLACA